MSAGCPSRGPVGDAQLPHSGSELSKWQSLGLGVTVKLSGM